MTTTTSPFLGLTSAARAAVLATAMLAGSFAQAPGQTARADGPAGWNSHDALTLAARARARRALPFADATLLDYQARAHGHVYFYLDRDGGDDRMLIRADQIALDVFWGAPDRTKQRIVGLRDESRLPNRQIYHLDHLTVIQDEFGDVIRMGDGDEVSTVPHPAAPGSEGLYDFRIADSLTLRLPGASDPIHVYELEVRPRVFDRPAFVGSLFVDRANADIVRMRFTFTPASYVDRRLDYIHVALDHGLWNGRHWLPHEQRIEIRRQMPEFDFPAGTVIQTVMRVGDYRFNQGLGDEVFAGPPVVAVSAALRAAYAFEDGLLDAWDSPGQVMAPADADALRRQAAELVGGRYLSGMPRFRFHVPNASAVLRYNRAEGMFVGAGFSYVLNGRSRLEATAGQATALGSPTAAATVVFGSGSARLRASAFHNALRDLGSLPGPPGALNTLMSAAAAADYLDPYFARGAALGFAYPLSGGWLAVLAVAGERQQAARLARDTAPLSRDRPFRAVRSVAEGTLVEGRVSLQRREAAPGALSGGIRLDGGTMEGNRFGRVLVNVAAATEATGAATRLGARVDAGGALGAPPPQRLFLLGGRETVPGYGYREFAGTRFALARFEASRDLHSPWVRVRIVGAAGWTDLGGAAPPPGWEVHATGGLRAAGGGGLGLLYDIIRVDLVRGFRDGRWQGVLSVDPGLRDIL